MPLADLDGSSGGGPRNQVRGNGKGKGGKGKGGKNRGSKANNSGTQGGGDNKNIMNPRFDPRILDIGVPSHGIKNLKRGYIRNSETKKSVRFLYNPLSIDVQHLVDPGRLAAGFGQQDYADIDSQVGTLSIGETSLSLLYDRTYECWDRTDTPQGKYGVYVDVHAFYRLMGLVNENERVTASGGTRVWADFYPSQPAAFTEADFYFGNTLRYHGVITSLGVTYTHFTTKLVPTRAVVNLSMTLIENSYIVGGREIRADRGRNGNRTGGRR